MYPSLLAGKYPISSCVSMILIGFTLGILVDTKDLSVGLSQLRGGNPIALREKTESKYIAPLLFCSESAPSYEDKELTARLAKLISVRTSDGTIHSASVYVRTLNSGEWAAVNEDEKYSPASLMKVAEMLAYFKEAEADPGLLSKKIEYGGIDKDANSLENFKPEKSIQKGATYTIDDLISYMIQYSDNNAALVLHTLADKSAFSEIYSDLNLPVPPETNAGTAEYMSVKVFSRFFRVFYNATYLSPEFSEKAIKLLLKTKFPEGIAGGVPPGSEIASKFGERTILKPNQTVDHRELHECGIVYAENQPYLLCIMTKGDDLLKLSQVIREISSLVYKDIVEK
jgi:beta-lactamase class A